MTGRVAGKAVLITGGASGLGRASAERLAAEGARIALSDIDQASGEAVAASLRASGADAIFLAHDTTREDDWSRVVSETIAHYGALDVLFNNAGVRTIPGSNIEDMPLSVWRTTLDVNLDGVFLGLKTAIRAMKDAGGSIINTSSIWGIVGGPGVAAYSASKGGVRSLTKCAALECAELGYPIRVNSIHPGHTETPMIAHRLTNAEDRAALTARYPIGRLGEPIDIAHAVVFLASDESAFMTGAELVVDGGFTAQ